MNDIFLIDFENVHEEGLKGLETLDETDFVYIIYTDNAKKLSLDVFDGGFKGTLKAIRSARGKQELDRELIGYLGFLIGSRANPKASYYIVSKDKGYEHSMELMGRLGGKVESCADLTKRPIEHSQKSSSGRSRGSSKSASSSRARSASRNTAAPETPAAEAAPEAKAEIIPVSEAATEIVVSDKNTAARSGNGRKNNSQNRNGSGKKAAAQKASSSSAEAVQETEAAAQSKAAASPVRQAPDFKTELNNTLMKALSEGAVDQIVKGEITSFAVKHCEEKNCKQQVYIWCVKRFGQKAGLEYYGMIREYL